MDYSPMSSSGSVSDRSEYARTLGARVGVNFGPVFDSVSYLMGRYCKSSFSLARCLEALNSDEKMRNKIAREIWFHYTDGILVFDKLGAEDLEVYIEGSRTYTPDGDGNHVVTGGEGACVGNDSDTVSNDNDDVETSTNNTVGLTDDDRLTATASASFGYDEGDGDIVDGEGVRNDDDDDEDADSDHSADGARDDFDNDDVDNVDTDGDDVDNTDDDATVQSVDTDGDYNDDADNTDDDAIVQSGDTDGDYNDDVDNTDDVQSVDADGDNVNNNNNEDYEDATVQSDDDSTVLSDSDDVVLGSSNDGGISNVRDSTDSFSPSNENVYIADCDENIADSSSDDSDNVPCEDNDYVSNVNFEDLVSPLNSYKEGGDVNDDIVAFIPSDKVILPPPPRSYGDNSSDDPPFNNEEVNTSDSDAFVTTSDEDDDDDHSYTTSDPIDDFMDTFQAQCMGLYKRGVGEGDAKFKTDPIKRRARLKKIADIYFTEKMDDSYPRIRYQKPTYQNGYEFGLTNYLQRLGKKLGVEFAPVFEGCAIEMGKYVRSTRTLQHCVDVINNDEEKRKWLAKSVWHHFIEGILQKMKEKA